MSNGVVAGVIGEDDRDLCRLAITQGKSPTQEGVVDMNHIHGLEKFLGGGLVSQREEKACVSKRQTRVKDDARFFILMILVAKGEYIDFMSRAFKGAFVQVNVICDAADVRFIGVCHHSDFHNSIVRGEGFAVKWHNGRMNRTGEKLVKLVLRDKVYEVKAGMDLLSALRRNNIVPESVIATRDGEMIVEDEILKDGDVIKLITVISGGALT